jgi:hypothetical protein
VHRGHLIEKLRVDQMQTRREKLCPDHQSHGATDKEHHQREDQIQRSDLFVIGGEQPARQSLRVVVVRVVLSRRCVCHDALPFSKSLKSSKVKG